jgi:hypothetical protein
VKGRITGLRGRLQVAGAVTLLGGFAGAVWIYLTAENAPDSALVEEFLNSKKYTHELKAYGGNATVLADELFRWFDGLWHGQTLAWTVAVIAILVSLGLFVAASHAPAGPGTHAPDEEHREA